MFHQLHYSGFSSPNKSRELLLDLSYNYYSEMFNILNEHQYDFILNRSHLGDYVYGFLYRGYDASYVFDLEKSRLIKKIKLVLLLDSPENVINRDDKQSFSTNKDLKIKEIRLFKKAFELTNIKDKILIESNGRSIDDIHNEIIKFVEKED